MDLNQRKEWNQNHKKLTSIILKPNEHETAVELFLNQHRLLHASGMSNSPVATLEDELMNDLSEEVYRQYPVHAPDTRNSIVWHIWHVTRIEDMTMNVLLGGGQQVLHTDQWIEKLKVNYIHSGNEMTAHEMADLSAHMDFQALMDYRMEVGRRTRTIVSSLLPGAFKQKVDPKRLRILEEQGAVKKEASWLLDYWGGKTFGGLILMPATRHIFLHLNKSIRVKEKVQKSMK